MDTTPAARGDEGLATAARAGGCRCEGGGAVAAAAGGGGLACARCALSPGS